MPQDGYRSEKQPPLSSLVCGQGRFGKPISSPVVTWSLVPGAHGSISSTGLYTAPTITSDVSDSAIATSGSLSSQSTAVPVITVDEAVPPVTNVRSDWGPEGAVVSWDQPGTGGQNVLRSGRPA